MSIGWITYVGSTEWAGDAGGLRLSALTLDTATVAEGTATGVLVGTLQGVTEGSTLSIVDTAGSRFALDGSTIETGATGTDYEAATSHNITVRETLDGYLNSPRDSVITIAVTDVSITLNALTLSAATIEEGSAETTVVGAVQGTTGGSSLSLTDDAGGRFAISGGDIVADAVATDYETATSHNITVRETLAGDEVTNSPRDTVLAISVTNVFEAASLSALTLDTSDVDEGTVAGVLVGTLQDVTIGSTLSLTDDAGGRFALDAGTIETGAVATDYNVATSHNITVRETLADSANSPRDSIIAITVNDIFSPIDLAPFAWYDPSDLSSLFTDDGVTNVTTDGDIVYRINDKSGNGFHLKQATLANRPLYKTSGGLHWLQFDGVSDFISVPSMNLSTTDKVTMFIGANAPVDDAGNIANHNGGTPPFFTVGRKTAAAGYVFQYRAATTTVTLNATTYAAPDTAVLTLLADKGAPVITGRRNGVQVGTSATDPGAGNFANGSLVVGLSLQTNVYGIILMSSIATAGDITDTEAWMAAKSGVTL